MPFLRAASQPPVRWLPASSSDTASNRTDLGASDTIFELLHLPRTRSGKCVASNDFTSADAFSSRLLIRNTAGHLGYAYAARGPSVSARFGFPLV